MHSHWLFVGNVFAHWVAAMSSVVSFTLGVVEYVRNRKTEGWVFAAIAFLFLIVAFDQAWQDEHRNSDILAAQKSSAISEREFWKWQSFEKDASLRSLNGLLAQNYTALTQEQQAAAKDLEAESEAQKSLAVLSGKILDINAAPMKLTTIFLDDDDTKSPAQSRTILLTNKEMSPVAVFVSCDWAISDVTLEPLPTGQQYSSNKSHISQRFWKLTLENPAWSPTAPLLITIHYYHGGDITCAFRAQ